MTHQRTPVAGVAAALVLAVSLSPLPAMHHVATAAPPSRLNTADEDALEVIRERFSDGSLKIERGVTTDAAGNYVNHGPWRMWDTNGQLVAEGRYKLGRRTGQWSRSFNRDEAALLNTPPFDRFEAPFLAKATFQADQLHGEWTIVDAQNRKCSRVTLKYDKRNGPATLWQPDGATYRAANFRNGAPDGELYERGPDGQLQTAATYVGGQQLVNKVSHFPESQIKQTETACLVATIIEVSGDDFWQLRFAEYQIQNEQLRHGNWRCWYSNGQQQAEGYFQYDREVGAFVWWHAHGQQAVKGRFVDGQPDGRWIWWHANGQKAVEGRYQTGRQIGIWQKWAGDGRLVQRTAMDSSGLASGGSDDQSRVAQQGVGASGTK